MVRLGKIIGTHGLRGALKFKPDNPESTALERLDCITLELGNSRNTHRVSEVSRAGGAVRLVLKGIGAIEAAQTLVGAIVMVPATELPHAGPKEFYYYQAIGCEVILTGGQSIGTVAEILATGANEVLVVHDNNRREVLIPVIDDIVREMDLPARRIVIEAVPGLFD